jgi:hypothetical protein
MELFSEYIQNESLDLFLTEQKNTHMTHLEDAVLYGGVKGARQAILALRSMRDMLAGKHENTISVKWDGAPAVFAGTDPRDGKFFVAKKGIFAKSPRVYKTPEEIDRDMSGDLAKKMKLALQYLPELGIKGVIQGDFMFAKSDLKKEKIDGENFIVFHPNTIAYAIPVKSKLAKEITTAKIGIVWHTRYSGKSFESMKASFGVDVSKLKRSSNVWSHDAIIRDFTNKATMTKKETKEVTAALSHAGVIFNKINGSTLRELEKHPELPRLIEQYYNKFVRQGQVVVDTKRHTDGLIRWITSRYRVEIQKRKTAKGKQVQQAKLDNILTFFSTGNKKSIQMMFELQKMLVLAKLKIINKLSDLLKIDAFVRTKDGFKVTGHEGFVAVDHLSGNAVKLVDRLQFSHNNFSPNILKGWDSSSR